ncbi:MAG: site-2 protease family protein [Spirochaetaceae bacterium]|jgi:Zn-dependent protease|nr:site-2 protease family protein [Spirochaetaceae bacterium]
MNFQNIDIVYILLNMAAFILAGSVHEWAHAYSAFIMGDRTAFNSGRMNINPTSHVDLLGTIIFPLFRAISNVPVLGWMKPVPVNPYNFKYASKGMALSAVTGPLSNLFQAALALPVLRVLYMININFPLPIISAIYQFFSLYYIINVSLMIFNFLPIPPLDGSKILRHQLSADNKIRFDQLSRYGFIILYVLMYIGIFRFIFNPVTSMAYILLYVLLSMSWIFSLLPAFLITGIILFLFRGYLHNIKSGIKFSQKNPNTRPIPGKSLIDARIDQIYNRNKKLEKTAHTLLQKKANNEFDITKDKKLIEKVEENRESFTRLCEYRTINPEDDKCLNCSYYANCLLRELSGPVGSGSK